MIKKHKKVAEITERKIEQKFFLKMKNWERQKREEIKERTIKGLEPSLNNIIKRHDLEKVKHEFE